MKLLGASVVLTFCWLSYLPLPVNGAVIAVCDEASLRAALAIGGDITFACDGTITLSNTIAVTVNATLDATDRDVTISGGAAVRIFEVASGVAFGLRNLTLSDGYVRGTNGAMEQPGGPGDGAAIYSNGGIAWANGCRFVGNESVGGTGGNGVPFGPFSRPGEAGGPARGAAIFTAGGPVFTTNCLFTANRVAGGVAGTNAESPRFFGQPGAGSGGAIGVVGADVWLVSCVLSNNTATAVTNGLPPGQAGGAGLGGALYNSGGSIHTINSSFFSNISHGGEGATSLAHFNIQPGMGGTGYGGAVYSVNGTLFVTNCAFSANQALGGIAGTGSSFAQGGNAAGGMLYASNGVVWLVKTAIIGNRTVSGLNRRFGITGYGSGQVFAGAVYNGGAAVSIINSTISHNMAMAPSGASASGGAVYQAAGTLAVSESVLMTNQVLGGLGSGSGGSQINQPGGPAEGGALHIAQGQAVLTSCALIGNAAFGGRQAGLGHGGNAFGGAILNRGTLGATNLTIAANFTNGGDASAANAGPFNGGSGYGAGVFTASGTSVLSHVTVALNRAQRGSGGTNAVGQGGGIFSTNGSTPLYATILAYNVASNCFGNAFNDLGFNISSDDSCPFSGSSHSNTDPRLGPVGDYGGSALTMPLLAGSPAIDAAAGLNCPATDQRGRSRPFGAACDIGAFESSPPYTIRGRVTGSFIPPGIEVTTGAHTTFTDATHAYRFDGLAAGDYTVVPSPVTHLIVPTSRSVSMGPDVVGLDFRGYRWNSMNIEGVTGGSLLLVYAGTNGDVVRIQGSSNLSTWSDHSTNTVGSEGLFEISAQNSGSAGGQYFRTIKP